jgi:hypothetical protein
MKTNSKSKMMITINQDELQDDHQDNQNEERNYKSMQNKLNKHAKKKTTHTFFCNFMFLCRHPMHRGDELGVCVHTNPSVSTNI